MSPIRDQTQAGVANPLGGLWEHLVSQQSKKPFLGVQEGVRAQLANRMFARLSRQFVSPGLSNRLSHP